jgi:HlyD family secretion protein
MPLGGGRQRSQPSSAGQRGGVTDDLARAVAGMKVDATQQAAFEAAVAAVRQRQQSRQTGSQGGGFGPGVMIVGGDANADAIQAQMRQRMGERFRQDFAAFRDTLDDARKKQWDEALSALVNAKRATLYKLVDGKPQPVMVRLGASDGTATEISGGGIEAGDEMIVGERAPAAAE